MKVTYKATAKKLQEGMQIEVSSRGFSFLIDEPKSLGGTDIAMSPVEAVLCTLAACQTVVAYAFAPMHNIKFEDFNVEVEGDIDPDGFLGKNPEIRKGFQEIRYFFKFKTDEPREKIEAFAKFMHETCPVGDNLEHGVKLVNGGIVIE